jgi:hypothetical protein
MVRSLLIVALLLFLAQSVGAQNRDIGAERLILDNGLGTGTLTIEFNGTGDQTLPAESIVLPPEGTVDQMQRHNGSAWVATDVLKVTETAVKTTGAVHKNVTEVTFGAAYQITETDHVIIRHGTGFYDDFWLPTAVAGREIIIRVDGPKGLIISPGGGPIDGALYYDLTGTDRFVTLVSDGWGWWSTTRN